jgi:hypothetical protein
MTENTLNVSEQEYKKFVKSKNIIDLRKRKSSKVNSAYKENFSLRKEIFQKALKSSSGDLFFIARRSSGFKGNQLMERDTACILLCKSHHKELLMNYAKADNDVNLSQTGFLSEAEVVQLFPTGLRADCFGLTEETKTKFRSIETTDKAASHGNYIPTKEDCERVIEQLKNLSKNQKIQSEDVLDTLAKQIQENGILPKDNWRIITKENFKIWFTPVF